MTISNYQYSLKTSLPLGLSSFSLPPPTTPLAWSLFCPPPPPAFMCFLPHTKNTEPCTVSETTQCTVLEGCTITQNRTLNDHLQHVPKPCSYGNNYCYIVRETILVEDVFWRFAHLKKKNLRERRRERSYLRNITTRTERKREEGEGGVGVCKAVEHQTKSLVQMSDSVYWSQAL